MVGLLVAPEVTWIYWVATYLWGPSEDTKRKDNAKEHQRLQDGVRQIHYEQLKSSDRDTRTSAEKQVSEETAAVWKLVDPEITKLKVEKRKAQA